MRTKALVLTAACIAAGMITAMAQNVYSVNVVGYVNKTVNANSIAAIANPLNTTNNTVGGLFGGAGGALPEGTQIFLWNGTTYNIGTRDDLGAAGWSPDGFENSAMDPGIGSLVKNNTGSPLTLTFVGEVLQGKPNCPGGANCLSNPVPAGYALLGSKVPKAGQVDGSIDTTGLDFPVLEGDQVFTWNGTGWNPFTADSLNEPPPWGATAPTIAVGESFFSRKNAGTTWVQCFCVQ